MAQLILDWLNEEVKLSRRIFSLEHDFKDGYLLGELLHKYNQQSHFEKFSTKGNPNAKITNFCLLEPSMRQIGVNFNAKIAFDVMHATNGTAKDLVYAMRATLEGLRKRGSRTASVNNENSMSNSVKIPTVLARGTPVFDKTMMTTFENSVRAMMENPNDVLMEQITRRFDQKKMDFRQSVTSSHSRGMETMEMELTRRRGQQKLAKTHTREFVAAVDYLHEDQWKKNQKVAHERRAREERFENTATQRKDFMKTALTNSIRHNVLSSIDDFEMRLDSDLYRDDTNLKNTVGRALKKMVIEESGAKLIDTTFLDTAVLQSGLLLSRKTLREKAEDKLLKESVKDRRRRRFLGEREISHRSALKLAAASEIISQILNPSQSEIYEAQYLSRVVLQKDLITENRINRDQLITDLNETEAKRLSLWREEETAREIEWVIGHRINSQLEKLRDLEEARRAADHECDLVKSEAELARMVRITEWVNSCTQVGLFEPTPVPPDFQEAEGATDENDFGSENVSIMSHDRDVMTASSIFWADAKAMFFSKMDIAASLPPVQKVKIFEEIPHSLSEELLKVDSDWILKKPFLTHNIMPVIDQLLLVTAENSIFENEVYPIISESQSRSQSPIDHDHKKTKGVKFSDPSKIENESAVLSEESVTLSGSIHDSKIHGVNSLKVPWASDAVRGLSEYLAVCDYDKFVEEIASVDIDGYDLPPVIPLPGEIVLPITPINATKTKAGAAVVPVVEVEEVPADPAMMVHAPKWLSSTPSKYFLGEVIVALRCAAAQDPFGGTIETHLDDTQRPLSADVLSLSPSLSPTRGLHTDANGTDNAVAVSALLVPDIKNTNISAVELAVDKAQADVELAERTALLDKNIAGEENKNLMIIAEGVEEVVEVKPSEASKRTIPAFSIRLALCGLSDLARRTVSEAVYLQSEGAVRVIRVDQLVTLALDLGNHLNMNAEGNEANIVSSVIDVCPEFDGVLERGNVVEDVKVINTEAADMESERNLLAQKALSLVLAGQGISDDVYVSLVIAAIRDLGVEKFEQQQRQQQHSTLPINTDIDITEQSVHAPKEIMGFIIEDFPTTKNQALLLVQALSGINYEEKMPQAGDKASPYAPLMPYEDMAYDISLCGLDTVLFLESAEHSGIQSTLEEIFSVRMNLDTNEIVYLKPGNEGTAENLEELRGIRNPVHTSIIDIALTNEGSQDLHQFLSKIGTLKQFDLGQYNSLSEGASVAARLMLLQDAQVSSDGQHSATDGSGVDNLNVLLDKVAITNDAIIPNLAANEENVRTDNLVDGSAMSGAKISDLTIVTDSTPHTPMSLTYTQLPLKLAVALTDMWAAAENQSMEAGRSFFNSLRDCRYQMVQRRRVVHDALSSLQVRLDYRQEVFDEFVSGFNAIDDDFRFDPDCAAELHLRSLELRETLLTACDSRKRESELLVSRAAVDGIAALFIHLSECEGAAILQAEYNRFIISLNLLFDYTKSMASYDRTKRTLNLLEETLFVSEDASGTGTVSGNKPERKMSTLTPAPATGSKKPPPMNRKGSNLVIPDIFPEPCRLPIPSISLPAASMNELPKQTILIDHGDEEVKVAPVKPVKGKADVSTQISTRLFF